MKGILFTAPMFHAAVDGRKTQTRRVIKPQPDFFTHDTDKYPLKNGKGAHGIYILPRYKVGETVYIKEPYWVDSMESKRCIDYKYDDRNETLSKLTKWKYPRTMPAKCARYFIEITNVRCERLQDISDKDCRAEGIICDGRGESFRFYFQGSKYNYPTPQEAYAALIDSINGKGTWESNKWVWVYDFKLCKQ